ncbi:MAG: RtcB family protein [Deltaproteobacteria bacterium]|jgi:tRNA-splicing ligase RtcB|nr:RtcB family protein [Deltaproteobacteria bacterium]
MVPILRLFIILVQRALSCARDKAMRHDKLTLMLPWEDIDAQAQQQILTVLELPELTRLVIMPDVHAGYDLCIGGVALLRGTVCPAFVGYDIGCGMCHVNTGQSLAAFGLDAKKNREELFALLRQRIPAGLGKGHTSDGGMIFRSACGDRALEKTLAPLAAAQLGTLGSGNHFLELGVNAAGRLGVTVHSGSRRCGYDIAASYMKKGRLLPVDSALGQAYLADMQWALDFALENRRRMLEQVLRALGLAPAQCAALMHSSDFINETHNHALPVGQPARLVLHRKGATPAEKGQAGVIPANQRDGVYITVGLGNDAYLSSASHGAGRKFSRKAAAKRGDVKELRKLMRGIVCRDDAAVLDEAPWAYKDIGAVLRAQEGIVVDIVDHFKPVIVLKG